jgi:hypothetical protein
MLPKNLSFCLKSCTIYNAVALTLTATEVSSGWMRTLVRELRPLLNNAHSWTFKVLTDIKTAVPLPVVEFRSDNDSEFINHATEIWCKNERLPFTRSRDHRKNDNCFVEQKNGAVVREYIGYDRLSDFEEQALLAAAYTPLVPLFNFFMRLPKNSSKAGAYLKRTGTFSSDNALFTIR